MKKFFATLLALVLSALPLARAEGLSGESALRQICEMHNMYIEEYVGPEIAAIFALDVDDFTLEEGAYTWKNEKNLVNYCFIMDLKEVGVQEIRLTSSDAMSMAGSTLSLFCILPLCLGDTGYAAAIQLDQLAQDICERTSMNGESCTGSVEDNESVTIHIESEFADGAESYVITAVFAEPVTAESLLRLALIGS